MGTSRAPVEILERARHGQSLDPADIGLLTRFWVDGIATDTQMAAWCTSPAAVAADAEVAGEVAAALVASGRRLEPTALGATVDLQTTGAVGDTSTLVAVPVAAALGGIPLVLAGGEREHFGSALTKLGAIPGMTTKIDARSVLRSARDGSAVIAGDGPSLAPAAARLDQLLASVGGTDSPALVAALMAARSIASGVESTVALATYGRGGVFPDRNAAQISARMVATLLGDRGRQVRWGTSSVEAPMGTAIGTALEIAAAGAALRGETQDDMTAAACAVAGAMAEAAGTVGEGEGAEAAATALSDGSALAAAEKWVAAQGGDATVWTDDSRIAHAPHALPVLAGSAGTLTGIDPRAIGLATRSLGAGRLHESQGIDFAVGVTLHAPLGSVLDAGQEIARVHTRDPGLGEAAVAMVQAAVVLDGPTSAAAGGPEWGEVIRA